MDLNNLASNQGESVSELNSSQITGLTSKEVNERIDVYKRQQCHILLNKD